MPSGVDAGDGGRPAPRAIVKYGVACVGVCADEVFKQRNRLLRRVQAPLTVDSQQIPGISGHISQRVFAESAVFVDAVRFAFAFCNYRLFEMFDALRIVCRRFFVKNTDILYAAHRLIFCKGKSGRHVFLPVPAIAEKSAAAVNDVGCKRLCGRKHHGAVVFQNPPILRLQKAKVQRVIPRAVCHAIWQIAKNHVNAVVRVDFHPGDSVAEKYLVQVLQVTLPPVIQKNPEFRAFRLSEYSTLPIIGSSWSSLCTLLFLLAVEDAKEFVAEIIKLPAPARHRHIFIRRPLRDVLEQRCYQSDIRAAGKLHAPLN